MKRPENESIIPVPGPLLRTPKAAGQAVLGAWILAGALALVIALYRAPEAWMPWLAIGGFIALLVMMGAFFARN